MKLAVTLIAILTFSLGCAEKKPKPLTNNEVVLALEKSTPENPLVGRNVDIRVFFEKKSTLPTTQPLVELLPYVNGAYQRGNKHSPGCQIWLVGFNHQFVKMKEGEEYQVQGAVVDNQGFYGAIVVYVRSIREINE